ncbi:unnamed protein product [Staurois parvus]|uniref:Uncharacterized protein n=1 Tax=Staurois parvus TaxID=386267 RepID=A0ABN9EEE0_9NEOB|nr:unnamed protein product [Staurois parvus]
METAAMGGRTGTYDTTLDLASMRRRYSGPPWQITAWQQAMRRPMTKVAAVWET